MCVVAVCAYVCSGGGVCVVVACVRVMSVTGVYQRSRLVAWLRQGGPLGRTGRPHGLHGYRQSPTGIQLHPDWWRSCMAYSLSALHVINLCRLVCRTDGLINPPY